MPFYNLTCECGETIEKKLSFTEHGDQKKNTTIKCPKCEKIMKFDIPRGTTFNLKGGGWASDGYSKGKK